MFTVLQSAISELQYEPLQALESLRLFVWWASVWKFLEKMSFYVRALKRGPPRKTGPLQAHKMFNENVAVAF